MSRVLVYQANGVQGAATVDHVHQAGYTTRALIRNGSSAGKFRSRGIEVAIADLTDSAALQRAYESVDYVILQIPAYADAFVSMAIGNAMGLMDAVRIKGAIIKMASPTPSLFVPDSGFSTNIVIEEGLRSSRTPCSVIEPTMYLDTLLKPSLREEISRHNLIDLPLADDLPVAWTTVDDAARMAVHLLQSASFGITARCSGSVSYTGMQLAAEFSNCLGRRIAYRSTLLDDFQRDIESAIGQVAAAPAIAKFRFLSRFPEEARRMLAGTFHATDVLSDFRTTGVRQWIEANNRFFA